MVYGGQKSNNDMVAKFRNGETRLMIAVNMLTQGLNVPEITDVFLAAPCGSDVRLSQMIGRGARLIPGVKDTFRIHDFFDAIDAANAEKIFHCSDLFSEPQLVRPRSHSIPARPRLTFLDESFGVLQGLEFIENQTFGIELEITSKDCVPLFSSPRWKKGARLLINALSAAIGTEHVYQHGVPYHESSSVNATTRWRVESDSSAGWEVISPILVGKEGLRQVMIVSNALENLVNEYNKLFRINHLCGFHLTLATNLNTLLKKKGMLALVTRLEPGLFPLVSPSRLYHFDEGCYDHELFNEYCRPLSSALDSIQYLLDHPRNIASRSDRYQSVNFCRCCGGTNLLEIRMHNGTVDFKKIVVWLSLWMAIILHATRTMSDELGQPQWFHRDSVPDHEDIFLLLQKEGISLTSELISRLFERRIQLRKFWRIANPKKYRQWMHANWYGDLDHFHEAA